MRGFPKVIVAILLLGSGLNLSAATGKIIKVLPHFLDQKGKHTLSPSLYERDAYQNLLRKNPELISALRFDINWKASGANGELLLKVEVRGGKAGSKKVELQQKLETASAFSKWTGVKLEKEGFQNIGGVSAWRATLWNGGTLLAETKSFLW